MLFEGDSRRRTVLLLAAGVWLFFALLGGLLFSMIVGPVLASLVFPHGTREWHNPVMVTLTRVYGRALKVAIDWRWVTVSLAAFALAGTYHVTHVVMPMSWFVPALGYPVAIDVEDRRLHGQALQPGFLDRFA